MVKNRNKFSFNTRRSVQSILCTAWTDLILKNYIKIKTTIAHYIASLHSNSIVRYTITTWIILPLNLWFVVRIRQTHVTHVTHDVTVNIFLNKNQLNSGEAWLFIILIHILSNSHPTPTPNTCLKCFSWSTVSFHRE